MRELPEKETLTVEFKSDIKRGAEGYSDDELVDEIVGMANTAGGFLYLGVEDDGTVTGLIPKHKDAIGAAAMIANKTVPALSVRTEVLEVTDKEILSIEVPESRVIVASTSGKILRRKLKADGTPENIPMYPYEITSRLSDLSLLDFSAQPMMDASIDDIDPNQMVRLREAIQNNNGDRALLELTDEEIEKALHFVVEKDNKLVPTVTGIVVVGRESSIRKLMPTVRADFQVLQGTEVMINQSYTKPVVEMAGLFEEYLKPWNPEQEMEYGLFRIPVPAFSPRAFREALMNAVAHRDYSMMGRIRVEISEEGMTISNPGGFIEGVNIDNLISAEPHGRNQVLSDALKRIGLAEKTGRGIDRIYEGSIAYGRQWPDYTDSTSNRVILFIPRGKADIPFAKMIADYQNLKGRPLSINYLLVLSALKYEKRMDIQRIVEVTHIGRGKVLLILEDLHEDGLIEEYGSGPSRTFTLGTQFYRQAGRKKEYVRQTGIDKIRFEEMILKLAEAQDGTITKADVVELLHLENHQAYSLITKLVKDGKLKKITGGRYAKYRLQ